MDRSNRFQLSQPPLMRLALIRTGEAEHRLIWSRHPVLLDGSVQLACSKKFKWPMGRFPKGKPPWQTLQESTRSILLGCTIRTGPPPSRFGSPHCAASKAPHRWDASQRRPPGSSAQLMTKSQDICEESPTTLLRTMTRELRLTLNTLVQGAWAMLLSRYSERSEVLFGTTVAGRPAELPSVETTLGLFTNTLPMRVTVPPEASLGSWLAALQAQHTELRRYEFCSAGQVHGWSNVAGGSPLYESCVVFQNYPGHGYRDDPTARSGSRSDDARFSWNSQ